MLSLHLPLTLHFFLRNIDSSLCEWTISLQETIHQKFGTPSNNMEYITGWAGLSHEGPYHRVFFSEFDQVHIIFLT